MGGGGGGGGGLYSRFYCILIYFSFRIDFLNCMFVCLSVVAEFVAGFFWGFFFILLFVSLFAGRPFACFVVFARLFFRPEVHV